ncbi:MAG: hypothetical protein RJB66_1599 [Pseudomonadota bacterium]|jgi:uncharacterized protein (TIGR00369 family)
MSVQEQISEKLTTMKAAFEASGGKIQLPPPAFDTLKTEFTAFDWGKSLTARVFFDLKFTNPLFAFQGGFMAAAIDNVLGPLSYMAAQRPASTIEMSTSYIRPFVARDEYIDIHGEVISMTKTLLVLRAEVKNKEGKLLATASQHALIINQ